MILIRGMHGKQHAEIIKNGKVGCRDLLSTVTETHNTGYSYSDYYEKYFVQANDQIHNAPRNISKEYSKINLITDTYIPYMYITYFHILNEDSEEWVKNNFHEDTHFIYYIPKLDELTGDLIGDNSFFGKKMIYVDELSNDYEKQNDFIHKGLICWIDPSSSDTAGYSGSLMKRYNALLFPLFQRVVDNRFNDTENEFRIIYISMPRFSNGNWINDPKRHFRFHINGIPYEGECFGQDVLLTSNSPILKLRESSLIAEANNNSEISVDSDFYELDISNRASEYGYIGTMRECITFIKNRRKSKYYCYNDTLKQIIHRQTNKDEKWDCIIRPAPINVKYDQP